MTKDAQGRLGPALMLKIAGKGANVPGLAPTIALHMDSTDVALVAPR